MKDKTLDRFEWTELNNIQSDLVQLDNMTYGLILYNINQRFNDNKIYTNVGNILIAVNPYQQLPLYTPTIMYDYINSSPKDRSNQPPHIYQIAHNAYNALIEHQQSQSIVISGESGAGKTESTKHCLQYIIEINSQNIANKQSSIQGIESQIIQTNNVLEAFGNAKTIRNNNSSRFGKYIELLFNHFNLYGCNILNYLLEKSRVVRQNINERNYHIFYQLLSGGDSSMLNKLHLTNQPNDYYYLNQSNCIEIDDTDDSVEYDNLIQSMNVLNIKQDEQIQIFTLIAAILHIGNITFESTGDRQSQVSAVSYKSLSYVSELLSLDGSTLKHVLTHKVMKIVGQKDIVMGLSVEQAEANRDALSKFIYEKLFDWIVQRLNSELNRLRKSNNNSITKIGILDIFGFEIFQQNSYEQLCINYTNEKLQQLFNYNTFQLEEQLYKQEGINFTHIKYKDNQPVIDLIDSKPTGLIPAIDEELRIPKGSDITWLQRMNDIHSQKNEYLIDKGSKTNFNIIHYAGCVNYNSTNFLDKNKDQLTDELYNVLNNSGNQFLSSLFPTINQTSAEKRATLGSKFIKQLNDLMTTLNNTETHYIRCIKPNNNKSKTEFNGNLVNEQLIYSGVYEAIQIRKLGYPFRLTHRDYFNRYKYIFDINHPFSSHLLTNIKTILTAMKLNNQHQDNIQIGKNLILYKSAQHKIMELQRNLAIDKIVTLIQNYVRNKISTKIYTECKSIESQLIQLYQLNNEDSNNEALTLAQKLPYKSRIVIQLERQRYVYDETKRLNIVLNDLIQQNVYEYYQQYINAVNAADDINLQTQEANTARQQLQNAKHERDRIEQQAIDELQRLDDNSMKQIIEYSKSIYYESDNISKLYDLLYNTSSDELTKLQYKAAVKLHDRIREIRYTIKLKYIMLDKIGNTMFIWQNYPKLYNPLTWSDMKFISFDKDNLAKTMLIHTIQPIHSTLTQINNKELSKIGKNIFKNMLGYSGDKSYKNISQLAIEVINIGYKHNELRNEIYIQLMKQCTINNNQTSLNKYKELLLYCLYIFQPTVDFENYLEQWLRINTSKQYINTLHQTLYSQHQNTMPQNESDLNNILNITKQWAMLEYCPAAMDQQQQQYHQTMPVQMSGVQMPITMSSGLSQDQRTFNSNDIYNTPNKQPLQAAQLRQLQQQLTQSTPVNNTSNAQQQQQQQLLIQSQPIQQQQPQPAVSQQPTTTVSSSFIPPRPNKPAPPPAPAKYLSKPVIPEPQYEFYVITKSGEQQGPLTGKQISDMFNSNIIDDTCICWYADITEWTKISDIKILYDYVKQ